MIDYCSEPREDGRRKLCCSACGFVSAPTLGRPDQLIHPCHGNANNPTPRPPGPGTHLKKIAEWWGFAAEGKCPCEAHAAEMDRRGPDWCEQNISLIGSWLQAEAFRRGWPIPAIAFYPKIRQAIELARKEINKSAEVPIQ